MYFDFLECPQEQRAFTLARCNVIPSEQLFGRYRSIPAAERVCPCRLGNIETLSHILLYFPIYQDLHISYLSPILATLWCQNDQNKIVYILSGVNEELSGVVAKYINMIIKRRISMMVANA